MIVSKLCTRRMRLYDSTQDAVEAVRAGKVAAYLTDEATLQYFSQARPHVLALLDAPLTPAPRLPRKIWSTNLKSCRNTVRSLIRLELLCLVTHHFNDFLFPAAVAAMRRGDQLSFVRTKQPDAGHAKGLAIAGQAKSRPAGGETLSSCHCALQRWLVLLQLAMHVTIMLLRQRTVSAMQN